MIEDSYAPSVELLSGPDHISRIFFKFLKLQRHIGFLLRLKVEEVLVWAITVIREQQLAIMWTMVKIKIEDGSNMRAILKAISGSVWASNSSLNREKSMFVKESELGGRNEKHF